MMLNLKNSTFALVLLLGLLNTYPMSAQPSPTISIKPEDAKNIGMQIWKNECKGTVSGLTSWNSGEEFASLGIGHFIWYPAGYKGPFKEMFPAFLTFCIQNKKNLPVWLEEARTSGCPWNSRTEFLKDFSSQKMEALRNFLVDTVDLQINFIVQRLQKLCAENLAQLHHAQQQFNRLAQTPQGLYALIDYVNFKGEGTALSERYNQKGWGLLQVLEGMDQQAAGPLAEFARSAKQLLAQRVANSPKERNEQRWLAGWNKRIDTYTN